MIRKPVRIMIKKPVEQCLGNMKNIDWETSKNNNRETFRIMTSKPLEIMIGKST